MPKITPCLWFDDQTEQAANFYVSIFPNSSLGKVSRFGEGGPGPGGQVIVAEFTLDGQKFQALNDGPEFKFTEAVSFSVSCEGQKEVDHYWSKLAGDGGRESQCGWLKDKFGLSWQIVPTALPKLLSDPDKGRAGRAMQAMLKMKKIDIATLERAADGK